MPPSGPVMKRCLKKNKLEDNDLGGEEEGCLLSRVVFIGQTPADPRFHVKGGNELTEIDLPEQPGQHAESAVDSRGQHQCRSKQRYSSQNPSPRRESDLSDNIDTGEEGTRNYKQS